MVIQEKTLLAGLLLYNDTEQYGHSWMMRALVDGRAVSPERSILFLCCALTTEGVLLQGPARSSSATSPFVRSTRWPGRALAA